MVVDKRHNKQNKKNLVNPRKHPNVRATSAQRFIYFLISPVGQDDIAQYRIGGQQLFYPDANNPGA